MTEEKDIFDTSDLSDIPDDLGVKEYFKDDNWDTTERVMKVFVNYDDKYGDEYDGREISLNTITISYYRMYPDYPKLTRSRMRSLLYSMVKHQHISLSWARSEEGGITKLEHFRFTLQGKRWYKPIKEPIVNEEEKQPILPTEKDFCRDSEKTTVLDVIIVLGLPLLVIALAIFLTN